MSTRTGLDLSTHFLEAKQLLQAVSDDDLFKLSPPNIEDIISKTYQSQNQKLRSREKPQNQLSLPSMENVKKYLIELCVERVILNNPALCSSFGYNSFKQRIEWTKPFGHIHNLREWEAQDDKHLLLMVQRMGINATIRHIEFVVDFIAKSQPFDPVITYLENLIWDGESRLDTILPDYFGGQDIPYSRFVGPKFMISAVARQFQPGCQVDTMLILEGRQGLGKTRGLEALFGSDLINDNLPKISGSNIYYALQGFMLVNIDELGAFSNERSRNLKSFLTVTVDKYTPKYENRVVSVPRRCVFSGTTNEELYLFDKENRRYWPYECEEVNRAKLSSDRDQLWAEAVHRYKQGESWWAETKDDEQLIITEQEKRQPSDPLIDELHEIIWFKSEWRVKDILAKLDYKKKDSNSYHDAVIGRRLPSFGFKKIRKHRGGDVWLRPNPIPEKYHLRLTAAIVEMSERMPDDKERDAFQLKLELLEDPEVKSIYDKNVHSIRPDIKFEDSEGNTATMRSLSI